MDYESFYGIFGLGIVRWYKYLTVENYIRHLNLIREWTMFTVSNDKVSTFGQVLHKALFQVVLEIHRF